MGRGNTHAFHGVLTLCTHRASVRQRRDRPWAGQAYWACARREPDFRSSWRAPSLDVVSPSFTSSSLQCVIRSPISSQLAFAAFAGDPRTRVVTRRVMATTRLITRPPETRLWPPNSHSFLPVCKKQTGSGAGLGGQLPDEPRLQTMEDSRHVFPRRVRTAGRAGEGRC